MDVDGPLVLPSPCLVVLVGPPGVGKSTWAAGQFAPNQIVSSDALRAAVGEGPDDLAATADAFALVEDIAARRLRRGLTTVIDSLALDAQQRRRWLDVGRAAGVPCIAVAVTATAAAVRRRNRERPDRVPDAVLRAQLERWPAVLDALASDGFDEVHVVTADQRASLAPAHLAPRPPTRARQTDARPTGAQRGPSAGASPGASEVVRFGLQIPRFTWSGGPGAIGERLREIALAAEEAGFEQLWVMDHFRQIPSMGRPWEDMLESWTTLGFLAGVTRSARLGTLVSGITYRNVAHLGKIVATLDVLSGGRAMCGLGAAWYREEHLAYGWPFPSVRDRYALLEDALRLLPLLWGPGTPAFTGRAIHVPEAMCYPRPLQEHVPLLVGGSGERTTLRLVARYADACNLFGEAPVIEQKIAVLRRHCAEVGRDPSEVDVTQLSTVLVGRDADEVAALVDAHRPPRVGAERFARHVNAGTVDQHVERIRGLAALGVGTVMVSLADLDDTAPIERFAAVIGAVRHGTVRR
jgi:F420-dependent oxidoreductase-like protein